VAPDIQASILESLGSEKAAEILEEMAPDQVADALNEMEEGRSEEILDEMEPADKHELEELREFREDTAGGLMNTEFMALPETATVSDAMASLRQNEENLDNLYYLFLVDADERLTGTVPLTRLFLAVGESPLKDLATHPVSVELGEREDRIAELFDKYNLLALPVIDEQHRLAGVISVDDIVNVLRRR
jgi:Mg/Co/Ni transporter MgtE